MLCLQNNLKWSKKNQKRKFFSILLVPSGANLLGNLLTGKGVKSKTPGQGVKRAGEGTITADQDF